VFLSGTPSLRFDTRLNLIHKYQTSLKMLGSYELSSLLMKHVNYTQSSFITFCPDLRITEITVEITDGCHDIQQNDTKHNDTEFSVMTLSIAISRVTTLSITIKHSYTYHNNSKRCFV